MVIEAARGAIRGFMGGPSGCLSFSLYALIGDVVAVWLRI